jgi:predicted nucleic acid-binding protein
MKASVYLETTILSYLVARPSRDLVVAAHQQITREWWEKHKPHFNCYISEAVIEEVRAGDPHQAKKRIEMLDQLPSLASTPAAMHLVEDLLRKKIIPPKAVQDAVHIAVAAAGSVDFLLTWNCTHIANAMIEARISALCRDHGFQPPVICTPEELMVASPQ